MAFTVGERVVPGGGGMASAGGEGEARLPPGRQTSGYMS